MAAVGEASADRFRPHAEALSSLGVTLEGVRDASEEMLSDALSSVGISLEEVRREVGNVFDMSIPDERRIPFSPRTKKALERALKEVVRLRDNYLGTEHVLLGISRNEDGTAVRLLARMGVSPEMLEDRLYELRGGRLDSNRPSYRKSNSTRPAIPPFRWIPSHLASRILKVTVVRRVVERRSDEESSRIGVRVTERRHRKAALVATIDGRRTAEVQAR